ncbi:P-loop containing nucleoside triphosphate hydrolase protein [Xylaria intraflava]|nr:P-loop containing nucleoside triphosphate hydrolase protein [Xylaria intraflava]
MGKSGTVSAFLFTRELLGTEVNNLDDNKITERLTTISSASIGRSINVNTWRHIAIAFGRRYLNGKLIDQIIGAPTTADNGRDEEDDDGQSDAEIMDRQAAHSSTVAQLVYALEHDGGELFTKFHAISMQWHALWDIGKHVSPNRPLKRGRDETDKDDPQSHIQESRLQTLPGLLNNKNLQSMYGRHDIELRDHQTSILKAMCSHSVVVQVAGTGSGKSIAYALPAYVQPDGCTIVIQPLCSLQEDTRRRLSAMGISVSIWGEQHGSSASVILVSPEAMKQRDWLDFITRHQSRKLIDRVILDEAQEALLAEGNYRRHLQNIRQDLDLISPRQVYLTGTLPPSLEAEFLSKLGLDQQATVILRTPTARDNLRYLYMEPHRKVGTIDILEDIKTRLSPQQLGIIYSKSREQCNEISLLHKLPIYYSKLNLKEKQSNYAEWTRHGGLIVATTALGLGIDEPRVDIVISLGAFDMISMCQQFGRAGRSGRPGTVILLAPLASLAGKLREYAQAGCKRAVITEFLDGQASPCGFGHNACVACNMVGGNQASQQVVGSPDLPVITGQSSTTPSYGIRTTSTLPTGDHNVVIPETPVAQVNTATKLAIARNTITPRTHVSDSYATGSWPASEAQTPLLPPPGGTPRTHVSDSYATSPWSPQVSMGMQTPMGPNITTPSWANTTLYRNATNQAQSSPYVPETPSLRYQKHGTYIPATLRGHDEISDLHSSLYQQQQNQHVTRRSSTQNHDSEVVTVLTKLKGFIDMLVDTQYCPHCLVQHGDSDTHYLKTCPRGAVSVKLMNQARAELNPRMGGLGLTPHTGCWSCGLPQNWHTRHDRYTPDKRFNSSGKCDHMLLFWDVLGVLLADLPLMQQAVRHLGGPDGLGEGTTILGSKQRRLQNEVGTWLRAKVKTIDGIETSNLVIMVAQAHVLKGVVV